MDATLQKYMETLSSKSCSTGSDLSLLNNPNLEADRAVGQFIQLLTDQSALIKAVSNWQVKDCKGEFPRFDSCDLGAAGACAADCLPTFKIQDSYLTYDLVKYVASSSYDQDMVDCGKFGSQLANIQMDMMMKSMTNAMERAFILGDTDLPTGAGQPAMNNLLGVQDGVLKKALSCTPEAQIIDANGAGPSSALFMAARKLIPTKYKAERAMYKYIVGPSITDWYAESFASRITQGGDASLVTGNAGRLWGNDFLEVPLWPENMPFGSSDEVTHVLFTPLDNLVHITQRKLDFKTEYDISCDRYLSVGFWRSGHYIMNPDKMVVIQNLDPCGTPWTGCVTTPSDSCFSTSNLIT